MAFCDLHTHSNFSDGTKSPDQLLDMAQALGLKALALTDHNTVAGLPEFLAAARERDLEAVPGCEFTTVWEGRELHMLTLFIPESQFGTVAALLEDFKRRKDQSTLDLLAALDAAGYHLDRDAVLARGSGWINRAHIGAELMARGYVPSIQAAFDTLLGQKHGYYKPPMPMEALEAIRFIRSIGALPVLAHPFLSLKEEDAVRRLLTQAKEAGLAGMEVRYPTYSRSVTELAETMAREFGLLPSGGSDFHGENKPNNPMGQPPIPTEWLSALKKEL